MNFQTSAVEKNISIFFEVEKSNKIADLKQFLDFSVNPFIDVWR